MCICGRRTQDLTLGSAIHVGGERCSVQIKGVLVTEMTTSIQHNKSVTLTFAERAAYF